LGDVGACPDENLLGAFAAGDLGAGEVERVRDHVEGCEACRELVAALVKSDRGDAPSDRGDAPAGPQRIGPFEVLGILGRGGMGEVYRARDPRLQREVAIKLLPAELREEPEWMARFEREARAVGALSHPNILAVHEVGSHRGSPYVVTELLDGSNLRVALREPIPARRAVEIAAEIATGLAAAHDKGIVHRDLKPENVFLTRDGRVKVLDFGLAKRRGELAGEADGFHSTAPGTLLGTVGYMAPEQLLGKPADARSDLFSLGVVLHEMLTGKPPFAGSPAEMMSAALRDDPPALPASAPAAVAQVVRRCLEKQPSARLQSASDVALILRDAAAGITVDLRSPRVPRPRRELRRWGWLAVPFAGAALFAAGWLLARRPPAPPLPRFERATYDTAPTMVARFLAGGESFVYSTWDNGTGEPGDVYLGRFGTYSAAPVVTHALLLDASAKGEIAFLREVTHAHTNVRNDGTLARMEVTGGGARTIAEHVSWAAWDPAGEELAVARAEGGGYVLEYRGKRLFQTEGGIGPTRFSPRGDLIAFIRLGGPDGAYGDVAVVDLDGQVRALSPPHLLLAGLAWSPAGDAIYYVEGSENALHRVGLDGADRTIMTSLDMLSLEDVAADGRLLVTRSLARVQVYTHTAGSVGELEISRFDDEAVSDLSTDGRVLVFSSDHHGDPAAGQVYVQPTAGGAPPALGRGHFAAISADGKWAVIRRPGGCVLALVPTADGTARELSFPNLETCGEPSLTGDGRRLVFSGAEPGHRDQLWVTDVAGGPPRAFSPEGVRLWSTAHAISPDGRFAVAHDSGGALRLYPLDGGEPRTVAGLRPRQWVVGWTADSNGLYVVSTPMTRYVDVLDVTSGERRPFAPLGERLAHDPSYRIHVTPDGEAWTRSSLRIDEDVFVVRL
jgi:serine/threonine protein kinase/Tol biopolymer transport system component